MRSYTKKLIQQFPYRPKRNKIRLFDNTEYVFYDFLRNRQPENTNISTKSHPSSQIHTRPFPVHQTPPHPRTDSRHTDNESHDKAEPA